MLGVWKNGHVSNLTHSDPDSLADVIELCAGGQRSLLQLRGTILHEAGHVLAGAADAGHGAEWKACCRALGLNARAGGGQDYAEGDFEPALWAELARIPEPADGRPAFQPSKSARGRCKAGVGARGGVSHKQSRLRKYVCACPSPKVYVTSSGFEAECKRCGQDYKPHEE